MYGFFAFKSGFGYDSHRFPSTSEKQKLLEKRVWNEPTEFMSPEKKIVIGGVRADKKFEDKYLCFVSRSDGDLLYHAVVNALLSALGNSEYRDIGTIFPNRDKNNSNRNSEEFVNYAYSLIKKAGYVVTDVKVTLKGKIRVDLGGIENNLIRLLDLKHPDRVLVQGTSGEEMDAAGKGLGMECMAWCTLCEKDFYYQLCGLDGKNK